MKPNKVGIIVCLGFILSQTTLLTSPDSCQMSTADMWKESLPSLIY